MFSRVPTNPRRPVYHAPPRTRRREIRTEAWDLLYVRRVRSTAHLLLLVVVAACGDDSPPVERFVPEAPYTRYVDPFIGTGGLGFGYASCFPGPQMPYGMIRPGPDTGLEGGAAPFDHFSGYNYGDAYVHGFSLTRLQGAGIVDYGAPGLVFADGFTAEKTSVSGQRSRFTHDLESAEPGHYAVTLLDAGIDVEVTASHRTALFRVAPDEGVEPTVIVDLGYSLPSVDILDGHVELSIESREIRGWVRLAGGYSNRRGGIAVSFVVRSSAPILAHGLFDGDVLLDAASTSADGADVGAFITLGASGEAPVVAASISFVDVDGALANLEAEAADFDFERVRGEAHEAWAAHLAKIRVEGASEREARIFYSSLYRALLMPTLLEDVDGRYRGLDDGVHVADGFDYVSDLSLWDTFRTLHPLLNLVYPEHQRNVLRSLVAMAEDGGYVPRWPIGPNYTGGMVGDPAAIVIAESWLKGLRDFDLRTAYDALRSTALEAPPPEAPFGGRGAIEPYVELGYVPIEAAGGSVSRTMEYAYADYALSVLAEALAEPEDVSVFTARAKNYENVFDQESGFFIGRSEDGTFVTLASATAWQPFYTEGNAYQYLFYAPHDLSGLAELLGGADVALERLDDLFDQSTRDAYTPMFPGTYYWHGNEPDLHYAFVFAALGDHERTVRWSRWVMASQYGDGPDGLPGNDDGGTLSAWYVFASLGLFPLAGTDQYLLGAPVFDRAEIELPSGTLTIECPALEAGAYQLTLDGTPLPQPRITHDAIASGGVLRFDAER
jgi:predicted alpha-1,2-mannosidase